MWQAENNNQIDCCSTKEPGSRVVDQLHRRMQLLRQLQTIKPKRFQFFRMRTFILRHFLFAFARKYNEKCKSKGN